MPTDRLTGCNFEYLVGVDEAGRGPVAGPVAVAAVAIPVQEYQRYYRQDEFARLRDSKRLAEKKRRLWFDWLLTNRQLAKLQFSVTLVGPQIIDRDGIVSALKVGVSRCLGRLALDLDRCQVKLDGGLKAPCSVADQQTIIKGDESEPIISLASVAAKVRRDRKMVVLSELYPQYQWSANKGYGTADHIERLKRYGLTPVHRRSFCRQWLDQ